MASMQTSSDPPPADKELSDFIKELMKKKQSITNIKERFLQICNNRCRAEFNEVESSSAFKLMIPRLFQYTSKADISGDKEKIFPPDGRDDVAEIRKGQIAEEAVYNVLKNIMYEDKDEFMLVFHGFKRDMPVLEALGIEETEKLKQKHTNNETQEFDFIVIHQTIGVMAIEVKGMEKYDRSTKDKASHQLSKYQEFLTSLYRQIFDKYVDHDQVLHVTKIICAPLLNPEQEADKMVIVLSNEERSNEGIDYISDGESTSNKFKEIFKKNWHGLHKISREQHEMITCDKLIQMAKLMIGLLGRKHRNQVLTEEHRVLRIQEYAHLNNKAKDGGIVNVESGEYTQFKELKKNGMRICYLTKDQFCLLGLETQQRRLQEKKEYGRRKGDQKKQGQQHKQMGQEEEKQENKQMDQGQAQRSEQNPCKGILSVTNIGLQKEQSNPPLSMPEKKRVILCGGAGTGKTLMIMAKAMEKALLGEKVIIFVPRAAHELYTNTFKNYVQVQVVDIVSDAFDEMIFTKTANLYRLLETETKNYFEKPFKEKKKGSDCDVSLSTFTNLLRCLLEKACHSNLSASENSENTTDIIGRWTEALKLTISDEKIKEIITEWETTESKLLKVFQNKHIFFDDAFSEFVRQIVYGRYTAFVNKEGNVSTNNVVLHTAIVVLWLMEKSHKEKWETCLWIANDTFQINTGYSRFFINIFCTKVNCTEEEKEYLENEAPYLKYLRLYRTRQKGRGFTVNYSCLNQFLPLLFTFVNNVSNPRKTDFENVSFNNVLRSAINIIDSYRPDLQVINEDIYAKSESTEQQLHSLRERHKVPGELNRKEFKVLDFFKDEESHGAWFHLNMDENGIAALVTYIKEQIEILRLGGFLKYSDIAILTPNIYETQEYLLQHYLRFQLEDHKIHTCIADLLGTEDKVVVDFAFNGLSMEWLVVFSIGYKCKYSESDEPALVRHPGLYISKSRCQITLYEIILDIGKDPSGPESHLKLFTNDYIETEKNCEQDKPEDTSVRKIESDIQTSNESIANVNKFQYKFALMSPAPSVSKTTEPSEKKQLQEARREHAELVDALRRLKIDIVEVSWIKQQSNIGYENDETYRPERNVQRSDQPGNADELMAINETGTEHGSTIEDTGGESYEDERECLFVNDLAVVIDGIAVICHPRGTISRKRQIQIDAIRDALKDFKVNIKKEIYEACASDVVWTGEELFIAVSSYTTADAAEKIRTVFGYSTTFIDLSNFSSSLRLRDIFGIAGPMVLAIGEKSLWKKISMRRYETQQKPDRFQYTHFPSAAAMDSIDLKSEEHAIANVLYVNNVILQLDAQQIPILTKIYNNEVKCARIGIRMDAICQLTNRRSCLSSCVLLIHQSSSASATLSEKVIDNTRHNIALTIEESKATPEATAIADSRSNKCSNQPPL